MPRILIIKIMHSIRAAREVRCIRAAREVRCIWTVGRIALRIVSIRLSAMHVALHRTIMLLCAVYWSRCSSDRLNMSRLESANTMTLFWMIRLHL